jgi:hypothetical protein
MTQRICSERSTRPLVTATTFITAVVSLGACAGMCLTASVAVAAPGDAFGGDDTGCVPSDRAGVICGKVITKALAKLTANVIGCHIQQAITASHSQGGAEELEEFCVVDLDTSAKSEFDSVLARYAGRCDPALIANAALRRDALLSDQTDPASLDALNGRFYCDSSSGMTIAEPGGDDAGYIPADFRSRLCSEFVAKAYATLLGKLYKCHVRAAQRGFSGKAFDEDACEDGAAPLRKGALTKYNLAVQAYMSSHSCPACLVSDAPTLGTDTVNTLDAQNSESFPCPSTTTTSSSARRGSMPWWTS